MTIKTIKIVTQIHSRSQHFRCGSALHSCLKKWSSL